MVNDDVLYGFRLRLFSLAEELGNVRAACRIFGIHPSTYYRWRGPVLRSGLEMLRPRSAGHRGCPTRRASSPSSGSSPSPSAIRARPATDQRDARPGALGRHRHQPQRRLAGPPPPRPHPADQPPVARRRLRRATRARATDAARGAATSRSTIRASSSASTASTSAGSPGTSGRVWQYTAIDLASSLRVGRAGDHAAQPVRGPDDGPGPPRGGRPAAHGWRLERVLTDNGSEFRSGVFGDDRPRARRDPDLHPGRPSGDQRRGRAGPADDPRGVLAAVLRAEPRAQADRPDPRPRRLPALLQRGARPHRSADPGSDPARGLDRGPQDADR